MAIIQVAGNLQIISSKRGRKGYWRELLRDLSKAQDDENERARKDKNGVRIMAVMVDYKSHAQFNDKTFEQILQSARSACVSAKNDGTVKYKAHAIVVKNDGGDKEIWLSVSNS